MLEKNPFEDSTNFKIDPSSILVNSGTNVFGSKNTRTVDARDLYGNARPGPAGTNSDIGYGIATDTNNNPPKKTEKL